MTDPSEDPSSEGSFLGAGGQPKAELHRPPPMPQGSCGCDHRHLARAGLARTGNLMFSSCFFISVSFLQVLTKNMVFNHCFWSHA
jgi:hypothetical protein